MWVRVGGSRPVCRYIGPVVSYSSCGRCACVCAQLLFCDFSLSTLMHRSFSRPTTRQLHYSSHVGSRAFSQARRTLNLSPFIRLHTMLSPLPLSLSTLPRQYTNPLSFPRPGSGKSSLVYTWWRALSGSVTGKEEFLSENVHDVSNANPVHVSEHPCNNTHPFRIAQ